MGGVGRTVVEAGAELPSWSWDWEEENVREAWPYVTTTWLRMAEGSMPTARPFHTVANRLANETAVLPGYLYESASDVDFDPRTYLGWQPSTGKQACCGGASGGLTAQDRIESLGHDAFFPALVIGSPLGYRTEAAFTYWNPDLFRVLVDEAVRAAAAEGVRTVIAPWVPDRMGNQYLTAALESHGAATGLWGLEDYIRLPEGGYDAYLSALPARRRRRLNEDRRRTAATGIDIELLDLADLPGHAPRLAELVGLSREKYGAAEQPSHAEAVLRQLPDAGVAIRCWAARRDSEIVGTCVGIPKGNRLFIKWVGFDYAALPDDNGLYFTMMFDEPVRRAFADGMRFIEFGMGSHEAKAKRNCESRRVRTAFLTLDPALRAPVKELLSEFSAQREGFFGLTPAQDRSGCG